MGTPARNWIDLGEREMTAKCSSARLLHGYSIDFRELRNWMPERSKLLILFGLDWSGRRDLNPGPPEPHSGTLPDCATSRPELRGND